LYNNNIYKLKEGNGYVKEYNVELEFEGEYLNGDKHGKGKEYKYDEIIFEGEYLNGKRWNGKGYDLNNNNIYIIKEGKGYGKEYNNELEFEGEYLNGYKNGKGKEYNRSGKLKFEGEYLNGTKKWKRERI